jgi:hypothetical protein
VSELIQTLVNLGHGLVATFQAQPRHNRVPPLHPAKEAKQSNRDRPNHHLRKRTKKEEGAEAQQTLPFFLKNSFFFEKFFVGEELSTLPPIIALEVTFQKTLEEPLVLCCFSERLRCAAAQSGRAARRQGYGFLFAPSIKMESERKGERRGDQKKKKEKKEKENVSPRSTFRLISFCV